MVGIHVAVGQPVPNLPKRKALLAELGNHPPVFIPVLFVLPRQRERLVSHPRPDAPRPSTAPRLLGGDGIDCEDCSFKIFASTERLTYHSVNEIPVGG